MNKVKKSFRLSQDIDEIIDKYAKEHNITYTSALERMVLRGITFEKKAQQEYELNKCLIEKEKREMEKSKKKGIKGCIMTLLK